MTAADPLGAKGKSEPKVMLRPLVKAIRLGSVYGLPAENRHHQDAR